MRMKKKNTTACRTCFYTHLSGIAYLHGKNVTHSDLKPANVLFSTSGDIQISDFGECSMLKRYISLTNVPLFDVLSATCCSRDLTHFPTGMSLRGLRGDVKGATAWYAAPEYSWMFRVRASHRICIC